MAKTDPVTKITKSGLTVTVRNPEIGEGEELLATVRIIIEKSQHLLTLPDEFKMTVEQENDFIREQLEIPGNLMLVPVINGKIAGLLNFTIGKKRRISHYGDFGVSLLPEVQSQGVGRVLMEVFLAWAKSNPQIETVRLKVHAKNTRAIALYRKLGFVEEGREIRAMKLSPTEYDDVIMMALHT